MCRLLGAMFVESNTVENHLLDAECSIFKQAVKGKQSDGWGIGFYVGRVPIVFKSEKAVYEEEERFKEVVKSTKGRIIIVHVRKASNPRGLPRERLISPESSQPFYHSNYLLAHNGSINIPDEVIKRLGYYRELVKSNNDSEVYFYLLLSLIEKENDVITAFKNVEKTLMEIFIEEKPSKFETPFTSLNTIFSDGEKLYAFSRYLTNPGKSICYGDSPVFEMCFKFDEKHLVVASEKTERGVWHPLKNNNLLICWVEEDRIEHEIVDFNE
ncbi:MAG: class II glutamine amidotransferase [Candidatus Brockarchaeota archaeon]|nr:class II glutamine amidotransferase [Candidatus Brockarchaeota archaeon]